MSFWKNKKVLVTGAGGFLGSNLTKGLILRGADVVTFLWKEVAPGSLLSLGGIRNKIFREERGSIVHLKKVDQVVRKNKIEIIFHLGAASTVEKGKDSPLNTLKVNVTGTWNVLEAARVNGVKRVILSSTTHVYGNNPNLPYKEEYRLMPSRPYETSKVCADLIAQSYAKTYQMFVGIPRFVNVYGPGDLNFNRLVPKVIKTILKRKNPKVWSGKVMRDFMYVDDAISAYLTLAEADYSKVRDNPIYNFGTGKVISILELAKKIVKISKRKDIKVEWVQMPKERGGEVFRQYVSVKKASRLLGWKSRISLDEGIKKTFAWYRKHEKYVNHRLK